MPCYHPLKGFELGVKPNGKKDLKVTSYEVDHVERRENGALVSALTSERSPYAFRTYSDFVTIPCGQCLGCRIDSSRQWANRMMLEAQEHEDNVFLTLTYDDLNVPKSDYVDPDTGEINVSYTLVKRDFQLFMKRLRKRFEVLDKNGKVLDKSKIRFYACGEYGSTTMRPHYHAILFNLKLDDLEYFKRDENGWTYYTSPTISQLWPFGFHLVTKVTWETCAYTARYVTKKFKGEKTSFYDVFNLEPEFALMSRRPGLAYNYFMQNKDDIYLDKRYIIRLSTDNGGMSFKPPRYFDNLYDIENPELLSEIKENQRKIAENAVKMKLEKTNLSYLEMLAVEEEYFKHSVSKLKRSDI